MTEIPQWVFSVASMVAPLLTGAGAALFARWRYRRNRQFSTVSDQKRIEALTRIADLDIDDPEQENVLRALYASIGMHFSNKLNQYTLDYINEKGLSYDHAELNHFLKSANLLDIDTKENRYEFDQRKSIHRQLELWGMLVLVTIVLIPGAFLAIKVAPTVMDIRQIIGYSLPVIFLGAWASLYFRFFNQIQHCISTKSFFKTFGPWLEQRVADETARSDENTYNETVLEVITASDQSVPATAVLARVYQWLRK